VGFFIGAFIMTKSINTQAIYAVFNKADDVSPTLAALLMQHGIDSRKAAYPFAVQWAAEKHKVKVIQGQRGLTLPHNSAAMQAVQRVLNTIYPRVDAPKAKTANKVDPIKSLVTRFKALTAAEKRRFLAAI
jgi:hypothetical protein